MNTRSVSAMFLVIATCGITHIITTTWMAKLSDKGKKTFLCIFIDKHTIIDILTYF